MLEYAPPSVTQPPALMEQDAVVREADAGVYEPASEPLHISLEVANELARGRRWLALGVAGCACVEKSLLEAAEGRGGGEREGGEGEKAWLRVWLATMVGDQAGLTLSDCGRRV